MSDTDLVRSYSDSFAAQFMRDGDGFLYRRSEKGPAVRISVEERNAFVAGFNRWMDIQMLVVLIGGILAVVLAYIVFPAAAYPMTPITIGIGVVLAAVMVGWKLAWDAPAKALALRTVEAPALSPTEARRQLMARTSWGQITSPLIMSSYFLLRYALRGQTDRWAILGLAIGLASVGLVAVQAYRKLRLR